VKGRYIKNPTDAPDFRIAHETITEADGQTVSGEGPIGILFGESVHIGGIRSFDGVAFQPRFFCNAPTIMHATRKKKRRYFLLFCQMKESYIKQTLFLTLAFFAVVSDIGGGYEQTVGTSRIS
jgi:hypothetical protein